MPSCDHCCAFFWHICKTYSNNMTCIASHCLCAVKVVLKYHASSFICIHLSCKYQSLEHVYCYQYASAWYKRYNFMRWVVYSQRQWYTSGILSRLLCFLLKPITTVFMGYCQWKWGLSAGQRNVRMWQHHGNTRVNRESAGGVVFWHNFENHKA